MDQAQHAVLTLSVNTPRESLKYPDKQTNPSNSPSKSRWQQPPALIPFGFLTLLNSLDKFQIGAVSIHHKTNPLGHLRHLDPAFSACVLFSEAIGQLRKKSSKKIYKQ